MIRSLFDTDVIIDFLRGNKKAVKFFESFEDDLHISAITIAELFTGVKDKKEREELAYFLSLFTVFPVTEEIAFEAGMLRRKWHKSHGMGLADALIAATAGKHGMRLISLNEKHFGMLEYLNVPYKKG